VRRATGARHPPLMHRRGPPPIRMISVTCVGPAAPRAYSGRAQGVSGPTPGPGQRATGGGPPRVAGGRPGVASLRRRVATRAAPHFTSTRVWSRQRQRSGDTRRGLAREDGPGTSAASRLRGRARRQARENLGARAPPTPCAPPNDHGASRRPSAEPRAKVAMPRASRSPHPPVAWREREILGKGAKRKKAQPPHDFAVDWPSPGSSFRRPHREGKGLTGWQPRPPGNPWTSGDSIIDLQHESREPIAHTCGRWRVPRVRAIWTTKQPTKREFLFR
jgi:hypothetical protein